MLLQGLDNLLGKQPFGLSIILDEGKVTFVNGEIPKYLDFGTEQCIGKDLTLSRGWTTENFNIDFSHFSQGA